MRWLSHKPIIAGPWNIIDAMSSPERANEPEVQTPPSPLLKTDGISLRAPHLSRTDIVNEIISTARSKQHVVVRAPPATG